MYATRNAVLSLAAGLLVIGGAQAADLPVKARAVEYVRVCSLYGAGFFYIPGTDTCIKIGGYFRADVTFNGGAHGQPAWSGDIGEHDRYFDYFSDRSRMALQIDTRTATEFGVVRTFGHANFQFTTLGNNTFNPNSLATNLGNNQNLLDTPGDGFVGIEYLFIQFAGFTFGKSASAYATPWQGFPSNITSFLMGGQNTDTGVPNIQYTADFGSGLSFTAGLEDPTVWDRTFLYNLSTGLNAVGTTGNAYAGVHAPDINVRFRVDQAWGLFQISAAAHQVDGAYNILNANNATPNNLSEISGHPDTKWGGSVMAGLWIKNIPTGAGDDLKMDASYAKGDTKNVISTAGASPTFAIFGGSGRAYQSLGFGATTDGVWRPVLNGGTGDIKLTEAFGFRGAYTHNWNPYWSSALFGAASFVRYDGNAADITTAMGQYCATYIASNRLTAANTSADFRCNPNFDVYQIGVNARWTPVKNLAFTAEVQWVGLKQNFAGTATLTPTAPKPNAVYEFKNQDTVLLQLRVQRNF
jgi:porin-like protein